MTLSNNSDSDPDLAGDLFTEPTNYYPPKKPATHTSYTLLTGQTLHLRLVGHNPLWVATLNAFNFLPPNNS